MQRDLLCTTIVALVVAISGCDTGDGPGATHTDPTAPTSASPTTESPDPETTSAASTTAAPTTTVTTSPPADEPPLITILTPPAGNGEHPLIEWTPVAEATEYLVVVSTADGPYWSSWGAATAVFLGGTSVAPPAGASGARLHVPMTVQVFAYGPTGDPLGSSSSTPIAP